MLGSYMSSEEGGHCWPGLLGLTPCRDHSAAAALLTCNQNKTKVHLKKMFETVINFHIIKSSLIVNYNHVMTRFYPSLDSPYKELLYLCDFLLSFNDHITFFEPHIQISYYIAIFFIKSHPS